MKIDNKKMYAKRWDYKLYKYLPYILPSDECSMYEADFDTKISCAVCGKSVDYGSSYSSRVIHNDYGIAYCVCPKCHEDELAEERYYKG